MIIAITAGCQRRILCKARRDAICRAGPGSDTACAQLYRCARYKTFGTHSAGHLCAAPQKVSWGRSTARRCRNLRQTYLFYRRRRHKLRGQPYQSLGVGSGQVVTQWAGASFAGPIRRGLRWQCVRDQKSASFAFADAGYIGAGRVPMTGRDMAVWGGPWPRYATRHRSDPRGLALPVSRPREQMRIFKVNRVLDKFVLIHFMRSFLVFRPDLCLLSRRHRRMTKGSLPARSKRP